VTSSGWVPGLDEVPSGVTTAIRDRVLATADDLGQEAVLWLAAPPLWTLGIAEAAGFPASPLIEFVRRACNAGWCKARGPLLGDAPPDLVFWMPDEARRAAMDELRIRNGSGWIAAQQRRAAAGVAQVMVELATYSAHGPPTIQLPRGELPGALVAWTQLMETSRESFPAGSGMGSSGLDALQATLVGRSLFTWTKEAVAAGDLGRAQDLVAAGEAIAGVLAGPAEQALGQARRMVTLGLRRRQDERALGRYLNRPELSDAVARLLTRDATGEGPWALHLRGAGGVGKTMLIKYLASGRYAADRGRPAFPVVRADFDYISPDYPLRRPVQLLLELSDELVLHTAVNVRADRALAVFRARAARAHEAASGRREGSGPPLWNEEVASAVDSFGDVLAELGDVLLVLDTCEELAKADLGDPASPRVRAMLDTIERLHQRAPSARVLLAGRRRLPPRPYLAVQEVDGFTADEAQRYLAASRGRPLPPELAEEMIRQSPAVDGLVPPPGQLPDRVSPFDLALYAAWAEDDPDLDVAEVRRGSDAYVESRIISRLGDPLVVQALPLLAAAGRCRVATLAKVLDCDQAVLGRRLAEQEWIVAGGDPVTDVAARPTLARSLRRYFGSDDRRAEYAARTAALGAALLARLRQVPLAEIDPDELVAGLRLGEPAAAAALWDSIADRAIGPPGQWNTVLGLTRRVLGEWEDQEWPTTEALRATVMAAHIAGSRRDSDLFSAHDPWRMVRAWASEHPDPAAHRRLLGRAFLGLLPYTPNDDPLRRATEEMFSHPGIDLHAEGFNGAGLAAAFADSVHRLLEAGEHPAAAWLYRLLLDTVEQFPAPPEAILAWNQVARARLFADNDPAAARQAVEWAEDFAGAVSGDQPSWPDWVPPDDLLARVRIERGLIAPPEDLSVLDEWESYAAGCLGTIDGERLASLCLRIRLRHGVVDPATATRWEAADSYARDRVPTCTAHDLVPPLFVSVAQAWFSAGEADRAMDLLDRQRRAALGSRQDELTVRNAEGATAGIIRRLRQTDRQSALVRLGATESDTADPPWTALGDVRHLAWRALAVVGDGATEFPDPYLLSAPEHWHAWWQSRVPARLSAAKLSHPFARRNWQPARTSADVADIQADLTEIEQLRSLFGDSGFESALADANARGDWLNQSPPPPPTRTAEPHREVRAAMRMAALAGAEFEFPPQVPRRLLAEMAFEEAELTALRLPQAATRLFLIAALAYQKANDPLGEYLARLCVLLIGPLPDGPAHARLAEATPLAGQARGALTRRIPAVAAALDARPEDAGPWRHWTPAGREETGWARAVKEAAAPSGVTLGSATLLGSAWPGMTASGTVPARARRVLLIVTTAITAVFGSAIAVVSLAVPAAVHPSGSVVGPSGNGASPWPWIAALIGGLALLALLGWYAPKVIRLARGRGIGAVRLGTLLLDVTLTVYLASPPYRGDEGGYAVYLQAGARPWRTAPRRARAVLLLLAPALLLAQLFRLGTARRYTGRFASPADRTTPPRLRWTKPRPKARKAWWRRGRGIALGLIRAPVAGLESVPWERILSDSLSPDAAGRIEWIRLAAARTDLPAAASSPSEAMLVAPPAWARALGQHYNHVSQLSASASGRPANGLLHVIGQAIATSAGPAMDVTGANVIDTGVVPAPLDITELERPQPAMVILQAEPAPANAIGAEPPDDQAEKLRLGAALAGDRVPAVLLLPVLPVGLAGDLALIITEHARLGLSGDAQVLLTQIRQAVAPHVPPPVLDDIVLFLNAARYRS
jgi:hypothetical protein